MHLPDIRYVGAKRGGSVQLQSRLAANSSSSESDKYEELLVNPALLQLATARGEIDCGGVEYLVIRYGHFFQVVLPWNGGHLSIAIEPASDPIRVANIAKAALGDLDAQICKSA